MNVVSFGLLSISVLSLILSSTCFSADVVPLTLKKHGFCVEGDGVIDLDEYIFLAENEFRLLGGKQNSSLKINGENIYIVQIDKAGKESSIVFNAGFVIESNEDQDLDVDLSLVFAPELNEVMVYWRETYKHKSFRQGLIRVLGAKVIPLCEGRGGVDSSH